MPTQTVHPSRRGLRVPLLRVLPKRAERPRGKLRTPRHLPGESPQFDCSTLILRFDHACGTCPFTGLYRRPDPEIALSNPSDTTPVQADHRVITRTPKPSYKKLSFPPSKPAFRYARQPVLGVTPFPTSRTPSRDPVSSSVGRNCCGALGRRRCWPIEVTPKKCLEKSLNSYPPAPAEAFSKESAIPSARPRYNSS